MPLAADRVVLVTAVTAEVEGLVIDEELRVAHLDGAYAEALRIDVLTLLADGVRLHDVSVGLSDAGRPVAVLDGVVGEAAHARGVTEIALSLSFTHEVATAMALLVTDDVRPKPKEDRDPKAEMLASFKQARSVIDELERLQGDVSGALG